MNMTTLETLIDEASDVCGSDRALCAKTGLFPSQLSDMRAGRLPLTAERVGLLVSVLDIDGETARRLAAEAIVQEAKPARKEALRRAFFVCWALGAGLFLSVLSPDSNAQSYKGKTLLTELMKDRLHIVRS